MIKRLFLCLLETNYVTWTFNYSIPDSIPLFIWVYPPYIPAQKIPSSNIHINTKDKEGVLDYWEPEAASSSWEALEEDWSSRLPFLLLFLLPTGTFFLGLAFSLVVVKSSRFRPQKEAPRFLMTLKEMVGGVEEHPIQSLSLQEEESLLGFLQSCAPFDISFRKGGFSFGSSLCFLRCHRISRGPISDVSPSSSIASTTEEEEGLKLLQTVRLTFGHSVGTEKRGPLP